MVEVPVEQVAGLDIDLVLTQSRGNWEVDRHEALGGRLGELPRVHLDCSTT